METKEDMDGIEKVIIQGLDQLGAKLGTKGYKSFWAIVILVCSPPCVIYALRHLALLSKRRDAEVFLAVLAQYIENPRLRSVRHFINRHMLDINCTLLKLQPTRSNSVRIDEKVRELSNDKHTLEDLYDAISSMQNIGLLVRHGFISRRLASELSGIITRMWELLEPLVTWEEKRRQADNEPHEHFTEDFQWLAIHMRQRSCFGKSGTDLAQEKRD